MSKGHKPGQRITKRSLKAVSASPCETRDQLLAAYEKSEHGTEKHMKFFKALHAHEKKHGCGLRFAHQP